MLGKCGLGVVLLAAVGWPGIAVADSIGVTMNVQNNTTYDFVNGTVCNQEKITQDGYPAKIEAGQSKSWRFYYKENADDVHLDIHWTLQSPDDDAAVAASDGCGSGTVGAIYRQSGGDLRCRTDVPSGIQGDHADCSKDPTFKYSDKN